MDAEQTIAEIERLEVSSQSRTPDRSAGATSRPPIEDMTKCWRIARGFAYGSSTEFAAGGEISGTHSFVTPTLAVPAEVLILCMPPCGKMPRGIRVARHRRIEQSDSQ
jgi:hypothetical protein